VKGGWAAIPPGTRFSTYRIPQYKKAAKAFAATTLAAMKAAPITNPGTTKRPGLPGVQYVGHPGVPGRRQPLHAAVLGRDRGLDERHGRSQPMPANRIPGDQVILLP
jgi:sorbitol/mannitol transport system substrate-binding protein